MAGQTIGVSGALVTAIEGAWADIRFHHPEVPAVVVAMGSGTLRERAGQVRLGHFAAARWRAGPEEVPELFVGGEGLERGANELLGTLLHEAAHGLGSVRGVQDTSRQGRYHNERYRALAGELGLRAKRIGAIGWSDTTVVPETELRYRSSLERLGAALVAFRHAEPRKERPSSNNGDALVCGCRRRIRVAPSVAAAGPILCGLCSAPFESPPSRAEADLRVRP